MNKYYNVSLLLIMLLPLIVNGQKDSWRKKCKFEYKEHLVAQKSTFELQSKDTLLNDEKILLEFILTSPGGEVIPYEYVKLKHISGDTILLSDKNGRITFSGVAGEYSVFTLSPYLTEVQLFHLPIEKNTKTTIHFSLGQSNIFSIVHIYSSRKLNDDELKQIVDELSNHKEIMIQEVCCVLWEI